MASGQGSAAGAARLPVAALAAAAALALIPAPAGALPQAAARQSGNCLPAGEPIAPIPWAQRLLAPDQAWPLATGAGQRVAVVSSGIADTPHLAGAVAARTDVAPAESLGEPTGALDCVGTGTGVAGIIAAQQVEGVGFHGLAPDARLLAAKVVGDRLPTDVSPVGSIASEVLASGIDWAVDQDATVIVVATITHRDTAPLRRAVEQALASGAVVVASVGERGEADEPPATPPYPAAYDGVIGVGAIGPDGTAGISRAGHIDLVAPGADLVTTYPGDGLGPATGTAFAAGYVAGAVALVRAYRPELSPDEVAYRMFATATPAPEHAGSSRYGYGIVNPYHAVLDRVVAGEGGPVALPPATPVAVSEAELARRAAQERSDALASQFAAIGLTATALLAVAVSLGSRARRRRWRAGLAATPADRPETVHPEPPVGLFDPVARRRT